MCFSELKFCKSSKCLKKKGQSSVVIKDEQKFTYLIDIDCKSSFNSKWFYFKKIHTRTCRLQSLQAALTRL